LSNCGVRKVAPIQAILEKDILGLIDQSCSPLPARQCYIPRSFNRC